MILILIGTYIYVTASGQLVIISLYEYLGTYKCTVVAYFNHTIHKS